MYDKCPNNATRITQYITCAIVTVNYRKGAKFATYSKYQIEVMLSSAEQLSEIAYFHMKMSDFRQTQDERSN